MVNRLGSPMASALVLLYITQKSTFHLTHETDEVLQGREKCSQMVQRKRHTLHFNTETQLQALLHIEHHHHFRNVAAKTRSCVMYWMSLGFLPALLDSAVIYSLIRKQRSPISLQCCLCEWRFKLMSEGRCVSVWNCAALCAGYWVHTAVKSPKNKAETRWRRVCLSLWQIGQ